MHLAVARFVVGCASVNAGRGPGGGAAGRASFFGLIRTDGKCCPWPGASSDPSPEGLGNVFGIGKERPIAVNSADVNADLGTEV